MSNLLFMLLLGPPGVPWGTPGIPLEVPQGSAWGYTAAVLLGSPWCHPGNPWGTWGRGIPQWIRPEVPQGRVNRFWSILVHPGGSNFGVRFWNHFFTVFRQFWLFFL